MGGPGLRIWIVAFVTALRKPSAGSVDETATFGADLWKMPESDKSGRSVAAGRPGCGE
jgi:hypothetical protein